MENNIYQTIMKRRSIRKFKQDKITKEILEKIVNAGKLAPSAANLQPLEFVVIDDKETVDQVFNTTKWAGYITPKGTPEEKERPVAYIAILVNTANKGKWTSHDIGACAENMILSALSFNIGTCWLGALEREKLIDILNIPPNLELDTIVAFGYPAESPVLENNVSELVKYWKDSDGVLHVPKRKLKDILHWNKFKK